MAATLTQAAVSTQYVQVQVSALKNGSAYDPTADVVKMAFITYQLPEANPATGDWNTAAWEADSAAYWASCLVGPANSGVTLTAGTYRVWVQVTDDPAVPALKGPLLEIT